ncbi:helix-turn-helix domain-containing protein [Rhizobium lentis]|uniref:Helix-turn-helix domain-containing protein n=1 Tax=Rhizobium lentis TaxID=1138194 RepID=A0A9Q3M7S4_9HYPH|nr:helix-turn-helix domain-containing protein [Rhizobium lentis]MBX5001730.1 helix-turn-helix domain-containing protein [Rhizobium lentis]MBX5009432.1 helix-turn-helix domain-containing protein [Rhizobium lentis]MBX5019853.1 helix-turn-helix domain-containing protein [Rhizobium lentis]MBX5021837.1 helix-turn-helix domain-containing protein [Rhizobium lentis]MBX5044496.1 helix-turn-helix domain-containing protein [Rhizobium lentis]
MRETLLRYVQKGKSVTRRANSLGIHPNTLYQRLQRIEAVNGRNMADASDFTLLSLACQTYADTRMTAHPLKKIDARPGEIPLA